MILLGMGAVAVLMVGVFIVLARDSGPTRSVAHVLYDVENTPRGTAADGPTAPDAPVPSSSERA